MKWIFFLVTLLPITPTFRGKILRLFFHNCIGKSFSIGFFCFIDSKNIKIGNNVCVGNCVRIKYLDALTIGDNSSIGSSTVVCGAYDNLKYHDRDLYIGDNCKILSSHYFDVVAPISIGNRVVIAGKWTQFYTHSFDLNGDRLDGPISIGDNVYIGAGSIINLGVNISSNIVIQGGTCVNGSIYESGVYTSISFKKRGEVREYDDLFKDASSTVFSDGKKAYYRELK